MPIEWIIEGSTPTPEERRDYIHGIFNETSYGEDTLDTGVVDLLADLMHYCDLEEIDFELCLNNARMHFNYEAEKGGRIEKKD